MEHPGLTASYLGTLGFTEPLEQLVLHTVPLPGLLDWLSKPKGPNLVEASVTVALKRPWYWRSLRRCYMRRSPPSRSGPCVQAALCVHGAIQCCLRAVKHMAFCQLRQGVRGQVDCITPRICEHL